MRSTVRPGDVVIADFGLPVGSEPGFRRPVVVVTAAAVLEGRPRTIHVVPATTNVDRGLPTEVPIDLGSRPSMGQAHLLTVIGLERISEDTGENIGPEALARIRSIVADLIDLE